MSISSPGLVARTLPEMSECFRRLRRGIPLDKYGYPTNEIHTLVFHLRSLRVRNVTCVCGD